MTYAARITALPPSAWLTSGTKDGVKKLSMPEASTNFSYVKTHRAWDWAPMVFVAVAEAIATEADTELSALRGRVEELERALTELVACEQAREDIDLDSVRAVATYAATPQRAVEPIPAKELKNLVSHHIPLEYAYAAERLIRAYEAARGIGKQGIGNAKLTGPERPR